MKHPQYHYQGAFSVHPRWIWGTSGMTVINGEGYNEWLSGLVGFAFSLQLGFPEVCTINYMNHHTLYQRFIQRDIVGTIGAFRMMVNDGGGKISDVRGQLVLCLVFNLVFLKYELLPELSYIVNTQDAFRVHPSWIQVIFPMHLSMIMMNNSGGYN